MFNLVINSNNVANSLNNTYEYKFKNGNFTVPENSEMMITSFQIPYAWYNISSRYNNTNFRIHWPSSTVNSIALTNGGSGYTSAPTVVITGTPAPTTSVESITVTTGGSGYTSAPTVTFSGGAGSGATGIAVLTGVAVSIVIVPMLVVVTQVLQQLHLLEGRGLVQLLPLFLVLMQPLQLLFLGP